MSEKEVRGPDEDQGYRPDMLALRNKVESALTAAGMMMHGGGVSLVSPDADLDMVYEFNGVQLDLNINIRVRGKRAQAA